MTNFKILVDHGEEVDSKFLSIKTIYDVKSKTFLKPQRNQKWISLWHLQADLNFGLVSDRVLIQCSIGESSFINHIDNQQMGDQLFEAKLIGDPRVIS